MTITTTATRTAPSMTPRVLLALIVLADLPTPTSVGFITGQRHIVAMSFDTVADGQVWSAFLGGKTDTRVHTDGQLYLDEGLIYWHGWAVQLHASQPATRVEQLDPTTRDRLLAVVGADTLHSGGKR